MPQVYTDKKCQIQAFRPGPNVRIETEVDEGHLIHVRIKA